MQEINSILWFISLHKPRYRWSGLPSKQSGTTDTNGYKIVDTFHQTQVYAINETIKTLNRAIPPQNETISSRITFT